MQIGPDGVQQAAVGQGFHFIHGRNVRQRQHTFGHALMVEYGDARRAADQLADIDGVLGDHDRRATEFAAALNHRVRWRHNGFGVAHIQIAHGQLQQLAMRRILVRHQVHRVVWPNGCDRDLVCKMRDLLDAAICPQHIVRELATVAIGNGRHHFVAIGMGVERNLGDLGKILAQDVGVLGNIVANLVEVDLLVKMRAVRAFFGRRVARVPKAAAVGAPCQAAAAGGVLHAGNDGIDRFAGCHVE